MAKNIADFGRFCYLTIPCLRINITLIAMNSSSKNSRISRKTRKQMFLLVSGRHLGVPEKDTIMAANKAL